MHLFKNYVWLLLAMLSCQRLLPILSCPRLITTEDSQDYATQYIMQILAASGTRWRGNEEWIKGLRKGSPIKTNFLFIARDNKKPLLFTGAVVNIFHFFRHLYNQFVSGFEDTRTIKAKFVITKENYDSVIIKSSIEDIGVGEISTRQEIGALKSRIEKERSVESEDKDKFSECRYKETAEFDDSTNTAKIAEIRSCITKMPLQRFKKEIEKNGNNRFLFLTPHKQ